MVVIAEITVPADTFPLGRVLEDFPDIETELERIVPLREAIVPLFWIAGAEPDEIQTNLLEHSKTEGVEILTLKDDETLFEVHWSSDINGLIQALIDTQAKILEASGTVETWDFRLRFPSHEKLSSFNKALTDEGIPITLHHIYNPTVPDEQSSLSSEQRETLRFAYREGYFGVPRRTKQTQLAEEMGISDSALSQRIRRGVNILVTCESQRTVFRRIAQQPYVEWPAYDSTPVYDRTSLAGLESDIRIVSSALLEQVFEILAVEVL